MRDRRPEIAEIPLETLVAQLRESSEASARLYGGTTYYAEELALFRSAAKDRQLFLDAPAPELETPPTAEGNEHQVWFREERATFLKATWPNHFGMKVVHRHDEEPQASPIDYLERWLPYHLEGNLVFFDPNRNLTVSDTHLGNIIAMPDGQLAPIDLRVQRLSPSLVDTVRNLCSQ